MLYQHEFLRYKKDSILKRHLFGSPEPNLATLSVFRQHQALQAPLSVFLGKNDKNIMWVSKYVDFAIFCEKKTFFCFLVDIRRCRCNLAFFWPKYDFLAFFDEKNAKNFKICYLHEFLSYNKDSIFKRHLFGSPNPNSATLSVFRQH